MLVDTTALSDMRRAVVPTSMPVEEGGPLTPLEWLPSCPRPTSQSFTAFLIRCGMAWPRKS